MATLPETSNFDATVYEILTTDLVLGGPTGPANAGAQNLTNRTRWLFDENAANVAAIVANAAAIALRAPINSPVLTGMPTAPTPVGGDNSTKIATTSYVIGALATYAPLNSPAFTGFPTAPTAASGSSDGKLANTAFVNPGSSLVVNGYRKYPDGSIEQWGDVAIGDVVGPAHADVVFPIPFPNACFQVQVSCTDLNTGNFGSGVTWTAMTFGWTASQFTYGVRELVSSVQNALLTWRAVGK